MKASELIIGNYALDNNGLVREVRGVLNNKEFIIKKNS